MSDNVNMRYNQRACAKAAISYRHFSSAPVGDCDGTLVDWSDGGLCFKASRPLNPGQCIYIRTTPSTGTGAGLRPVTLAQVRWCDESRDPYKVEYTIGASYL